MEPTLHCARPGSECEARFSDRVLACRFCYRFWSPKRGDIVVFKTPPLAAVRCGAGGTFVKRLIGLPGRRLVREQRLRLHQREDARTSPISSRTGETTARLPGCEIPKGQYFFMGDNRASSCDSRSWGTVPRGNLIGKVFATYWPPSRISIR